MDAPPQPTPSTDATSTRRGEAVLVARDVRKSFRVGDRSIEVLHGAHLSLHARERLCLMGSSGAGKSTFLHVLGLLEPPTEGEVLVGGRSAWELPVPERAALRNRHIGFVFQAYHLLPDLTALENVVLPVRIAGSYGTVDYDPRRHAQEASEMLDRFGLGSRLTHRPNQLSGGERQRVAIARALILRPRILIADEPTGNLDTGTGERVLELLLEQQRERDASLLLVTHDERIAQHCDRTLVMQDGQIELDSGLELPQ
jgi:predicted ABC-type transport system involved in lysophospholipase L1 biosynthesis ATPase subunit